MKVDLKSICDLIERHFKDTLIRLMRLPKKTPRSVVYFLAGSIPGIALLHTRQLSLFGMITRQSGSILHTHAFNLFSSQTICKLSWFHQIRNLCLLYALPHPLDLLNSPPSRLKFKNLVKKKIISHWEDQLRSESAILPSLEFFHPEYMSLTRPHLLYSTAGSSPAKISMASVQATLLSGRYRTEALTRHWSSNKSGICLLSPTCRAGGIKEDLRHMLQLCPALQNTRKKLEEYTVEATSSLDDHIQNVIFNLCSPTSLDFCQFLLDCSSLPAVISLAQQHGADTFSVMFQISRTWVFVLHRERLRRLDRWEPGMQL